CLPSRLSRVRAPSPAPLTQQVSLQADDKSFEDKQSALRQARRRCCFLPRFVQRPPDSTPAQPSTDNFNNVSFL
ncbi:MAG TPA: hypothetical protein VED37_20200, partial [Ktedonobacteraceae bacterium]|nr:hypothetical protein [Ktedonobacteraceae bacterium]